MNPRDLSAQIASLRHLLTFANSDEIRACAQQALQTLEWIERREDLIKMIEKLRNDNPGLYDTFVYLSRTFPGMSISDIRATEKLTEDMGL